MKTFKDRLNTLLETTIHKDLKNEINSIVSLDTTINESIQQEIFIKKANSYKLSKSEREFVKNEEKIHFLKTLGLQQIFEKIASSDLKSVPQFPYKVAPLAEMFKNGLSPVVIMDRLYETLMGYQFNPVAASIMTDIKDICEEYAEDIVVLRHHARLSNIRNSNFYKSVLESMQDFISDKGSRGTMMTNLEAYKHEPTVKSLLEYFRKQDPTKLHLNEFNDNFTVNPIYSVVYRINDSQYYFQSMGDVFVFENNTINLVENKNTMSFLPETFFQLNNFLTNPNVVVTNERVTVKFTNAKIELVNEDDHYYCYLNGNLVETDRVYEYCVRSGMFQYNEYEGLRLTEALWNNMSLLVNVDFGKNIVSNVENGVSASLYKIDENFYTRYKDVLRQRGGMLTEVNAMQATNALYEFMGFNATSALYEYMEGPQGEIGKIKADQKVINERIHSLVNNLKKVQTGIDTVGQEEELLELKSAITEEIDSLKERFHIMNHQIEMIEKKN